MSHLLKTTALKAQPKCLFIRYTNSIANSESEIIIPSNPKYLDMEE